MDQIQLLLQELCERDITVEEKMCKVEVQRYYAVLQVSTARALEVLTQISQPRELIRYPLLSR